MARTITEIKASITTSFMADETVAAFYGFTVGAGFDATFSKAGFESILFYIVASAIYVVESLMDVLRSDVDTDLSARLVPGRKWWRDLAIAFQYGDAYNEEAGKYDVIDDTKQIVAYAAVEEPSTGGVRLKVAKTAGAELSALDAPELLAFTEYIRVAKPLGVKSQIVSVPGDDLRIVIDIYYDPLVLDADGNALDGSGEPVPSTVRSFVKSLPFNGEFVIASLVDALQATKGVKVPTVLSAESKYLTTDWEAIDARVKPYSGWMKVTDENLTITYRPHDVD